MRASCLLLNNSFSSQLWAANTRLGGDSSAAAYYWVAFNQKNPSLQENDDPIWRDSLARPPISPWWKWAQNSQAAPIQKQNLFLGVLLGGISFGMSLQADMCYVSLSAAGLVLRKRPEVSSRLSKAPTPTRWPVWKVGASIQMQQVGISKAAAVSSAWTVVYLLFGLIMSFSCWSLCLSGPRVTSSFSRSRRIAPFGTKQVIESLIKSVMNSRSYLQITQPDWRETFTMVIFKDTPALVERRNTMFGDI